MKPGNIYGVSSHHKTIVCLMPKDPEKLAQKKGYRADGLHLTMASFFIKRRFDKSIENLIEIIQDIIDNEKYIFEKPIARVTGVTQVGKDQDRDAVLLEAEWINKLRASLTTKMYRKKFDEISGFFDPHITIRKASVGYLSLPFEVEFDRIQITTSKKAIVWNI